MTIENFGGRKFVFAMFVVSCAFVLVCCGLINYTEFMTVIVYALGIFSVSNAVAHLSDSKEIYEIEKIKKDD